MRPRGEDGGRSRFSMSSLRGAGSERGAGLFAALVLFFAALMGCSRPIDEKRCVQLLDHYTDRLIDQSRPGASSSEREQLRARARAKALLDPEFRACPERVTEEAFNCAANAASSDEMERCLM